MTFDCEKEARKRRYCRNETLDPVEMKHPLFSFYILLQCLENNLFNQ